MIELIKEFGMAILWLFLGSCRPLTNVLLKSWMSDSRESPLMIFHLFNEIIDIVKRSKVKLAVPVVDEIKL
ncbi:Uncharacterised protein [Streptococcus pneumoniae]|nr:Uncharacterised protein [Streptococcus pneumoniae]VKZ09991.1 Uncharacterised protein [Streptococcus pneumoniae]VNF18283.1 Uncharacterised protein [Streptococcus pneumoniae]